MAAAHPCGGGIVAGGLPARALRSRRDASGEEDEEASPQQVEECNKWRAALRVGALIATSSGWSIACARA
jgi:hypothetical protein